MLNPGDSLSVKMYGERGEIIQSKITYSDSEKSCGWVKINPIVNRNAIVVGYETRWFHKPRMICAVEGIAGLVEITSKE
jgi:hypothetical protein